MDHYVYEVLYVLECVFSHVTVLFLKDVTEGEMRKEYLNDLMPRFLSDERLLGTIGT